MTPDVNVLLAASRSDHPQHRIALDWLTQALNECASGATLHVLPMIAAGFLRIATHPKVFSNPTPIADALQFLRAVLDVPGVELVPLGPEWPSLERLCAEHRLAGNAIPDAWIAASVRATGGHLVTFDRGFKALLERGQLTVLNP